MDFRLFGPFEVWHDGAQVDPGDLQQRYVLVILLRNANRAVSREYLRHTVWLGQDQPRSDLITSYVARLRKVFRDAGATDVLIDKTPTGYQLRVDENLLDTVRFTALCRRAAGAPPPVRRRLLAEALDLWRGRFLSDLDIDRAGGAAGAPTEESRVDALVDLAELELAAGEHRAVRDRLRAVWEDNRAEQRVAAMLMRTLVTGGDQVRAVTVYHQTRDALAELGMETARELRDMVWLAQYGTRHNALPAHPPRFTGRDAEVAAVEALARGGDATVVWVSGLPGVGKTAFAVHVAHRLAGRYPDGTLFVELAGFTPGVEPTDPADALASLLADLGVPPEALPQATPARAELYRDRLAGTRTLVVLDNAAGEEQVTGLLPAAPGCLTLVTSRDLGSAGPGLAATDHLHLEPLSVAEASELFGRLVDPERIRARADLVREVVARCGRVPLLIHLVAAQLRRHTRWPLEHLVALLAETGPVSGLADAAYAVSYQQLRPAARRLFRLVALAPVADLSAGGAAALLDRPLPAARELLVGLHRASLLEEPAPGRFQMLDPLRDFARRSSEVDTSEAAAVVRLLDHYRAGTASAMATAFPHGADRQPAVPGPWPPMRDPHAALDWLDTERPNLVSAVRHAAANGLPEHAWQLAVLLWRYLYTAGHLRDWTETLRLADGVVTDREGQANVRLGLATARLHAGALADAHAIAHTALPLWLAHGDPRGAADTRRVIATAAKDLGAHDEAGEQFAAALASYRALGERHGQAAVLDHLGQLDELHDRLAQAQRRHVAALGLLRELGHDQGVAHVLDNLGGVRQRLGRLTEALADHTEAHDLAVAAGDRACEAYALNNLGNTHRLLGRLPEATHYHQRAAAVAELVVDPGLRTQLCLDRGETAAAGGNPRAAVTEFQAALTLSTGTGDRAKQARANARLGALLHLTGHHSTATTHWLAALTGYESLGLPEAARVRAELAGLACSRCAATTIDGL